ncbi:hypothetical protein ACHAXA_002774 [Cyclostephanos tholiformis]|uniref:Programmed cell death protein 2 C-terminal domain-containing protein n=1 Tax=Cyclostephanos tholiformis TaxID=382380 RepID=A0ABD3RIC9_9STRA
MWSSGKDADDDGEPVLLFMPAVAGANDSRPRNRKKNRGWASFSPSSTSDPSSSHAGGLPCYHEGDARPSFPSSLSVVVPPSSTPRTTTTTNPQCTTCGDCMHLLLQLHSPVDDYDRTLYVFGCNNRTCHHPPSTTSDNGGEYGDEDETAEGGGASAFRSWIGSGPVRCLRSQRRWTAATKCDGDVDDPPPPGNRPTTRDDDYWGADDAGIDGGGWGDGVDDVEDDWGVSTNGADVSVDDLEAMMNECEMMRPATNVKTGRNPSSSSSSSPSQTLREKHDADDDADCGASSTTNTRNAPPSFEHIDLLTMNEPPTRRRRGGSDDSDDDDGEDYDDEDEDFGSGDNNDASKVGRMLSRYLDLEDDEEILSALRSGLGANNRGDSREGVSGGGERYERLPPEERAFLYFTRRLRRAPGQVCRYAYGGSPLWSVPATPPPSHDATVDRSRYGVSAEQRKKHKSKKMMKQQHKKYMHSYTLPAVPNCVCGHRRVFEFQVLPSLLHVLDVDGHAAAVRGKEDDDDDGDVLDLINSGGMNWGSIAVYSCPLSCDDSREEFVVVQEAVDDAPTKKNGENENDSDGDD